MTARKPPSRLMTPGEVADLFRVDSKTVIRWADAGRLRCIRTISLSDNPGHRRFWRAEVYALLAGKPLTAAELDELVRGETP